MSAARKSKPPKPYWEMTTAELREATREFDQEFVIDTFRPLTPEERKYWEGIQRNLKLTDPNIEYRRVTTRLPRSLIKEIDAMAKTRKVSRAKMIRLALGVYLAHKREEGGKR